MWNRREVMHGSTWMLAGLVLPARLTAAEDGGTAAAPETPARPASSAPAAGPFTLPPLAYAYDALEPAIDAETMRLHHDKHHATYVTKLNEAVAAAPALAGKSVEALLRDLATLPDSVHAAVRNHGGGHANHTLFWASLRPASATPPGGKLAAAIRTEFGSFDSLREQLIKAAGGVFGSGWAWLTLDSGRKLAVGALPNQDSPLSAGQTPLLGIDVWEHAYYLKYQNRRADYLQALLTVVDWPAVERRYEAAVAPA
jgi:Fe-Mn family superoxide dismutase